MKSFARSLSIVVLLASCGDDEARVTDTIAPAESRPAPTTALETLGNERLITTAGSPAPAMRTASIEQVRLTSGRIEVRPMLPRMHTVFRIRNESAQPHALRVSAGEIATTMTQPVAPGREVIMQIELRRGRHLVTCTIPGHSERTEFATYEPNQRPD